MVPGISHDSPDFVLLMVKESEEMYIELLKADMKLETVFTSKALDQIIEELEKRKMELGTRSKTSQLWLNYQGMVKVAR